MAGRGGALRRLAALALVGLLAGCGGREQGTGDADPARIAPADAAAYFVADLQPAGEHGAAAQQIVSRLPVVPDPDEVAVEVLADALGAGDSSGLLTELGGVPAIGRRAALVVTGASAGEPQMAAILPTVDATAVARALARVASRIGPPPAPSGPVRRSYKGVEYLVMPDYKDAAGLVDSFLVVGDEASLRAVIDASQGSGLAAHPPFAATAPERQDAVLSGYLDPRALGSLLEPGPTAGPEVIAARAASQAGAGPISFAARADPGRVTLSVVTRGSRSPEGPNPPTQVVADLPDDAWLVSAVPRLGEQLRRARTGLSPAEAASFAMWAAEVRRETGLDLYRDVAPAIGDVAIFIRGSIGAAMRQGMVATTTSPAAAQRLIARIRPSVTRRAAKDGLGVLSTRVGGAAGFVVRGREIPAGLYFLARGNRLVVAQGNANALAALSPPRRLASVPAFQVAQASVGREPLFYLAFAPLTRLFATSLTQEEREVARYLQILRTAAVVTDVTGGTETTRIVFTLS